LSNDDEKYYYSIYPRVFIGRIRRGNQARDRRTKERKKCVFFALYGC